MANEFKVKNGIKFADNTVQTTAGIGTVTSVVAGTGLNGGTITSTGTISLANTAVTAGSYTLASITVDAQGRITTASSGSVGSGSGLNADLLDGQHASAFATAAQGILADTALQPAAIGTTVQNYSTNLTNWSAITTSTKQDTLISGTNIKTINGSSILGSGNLTISGNSSSVGFEQTFLLMGA